MEDGTSLMEQISKTRTKNKQMEQTSWAQVIGCGHVVEVHGLAEDDGDRISLGEIRKRLQNANT